MSVSRKMRYWFPGAVYHITSRGNRKSAVFYDDHDRLTYLRILKETKTLFPFYLHSYCLMSNHLHFQLETIQHHPMYIMKMLQSRYAMYFNKRHQLNGHVFQGRYGSEIIDSIAYQVDVSRYIHMNPVDANIVKSPEAYLWSSYPAYLSPSPSPDPLVTTERILSYFPEPQKENYRKFVESFLILEE